MATYLQYARVVYPQRCANLQLDNAFGPICPVGKRSGLLRLCEVGVQNRLKLLVKKDLCKVLNLLCVTDWYLMHVRGIALLSLTQAVLAIGAAALVTAGGYFGRRR